MNQVCKMCKLTKIRELKTIVNSKRYVYINENGKQWRGKTCPNCCTLYTRDRWKKEKQNNLLTKPIRICIQCKNEFKSFRPEARYCSKICHKNFYNNKRKTVRKCITCKILLGNTTKTKCLKCKLPKTRYAYVPKVPFQQICLKCKNTFLSNKKKYCSPKCRKKSNKNPLLHKMYKKLRKRAIKQAKPKWCKWKEIVEVYVNCPEGMEVDHIHPLKHPDVCGLHVPWNLQYLSKEDNNKKSNSFDYTYENLGWKK